MAVYTLDSKTLGNLIVNGFNNLKEDEERINSLNVFPVPDGDTGTNMRMTIEGGVKYILSNSNNLSVADYSKAMARSMVLTARGNSGVILSQFFKGLSIGLEGLTDVTPSQFANALCEATKKAYHVVSNPTEGTILTVMREASTYTKDNFKEGESFDTLFSDYITAANESLKHTPELLPVLKKAGVIDSGGAGFILIIQGMYEALTGHAKEVNLDYTSSPSTLNTSGFNADSELTYGYCTEFILQLQNKKVDIPSFDIKTVTDFLETIGNSIVAFKDEDIVKVHVHTMDPGKVLSEFRKYGEYLTLKIENMNVQHTEGNLVGNQEETKEHKKYASVAVATGAGLVEAFKELGVDEVVEGGQTMNTSTEDFINTFKKIDAQYILVYPNNSNIKLAAKMAAESYDASKVIVIPTSTIAEGYTSIAMLNYDSDNIDEIVNEVTDAFSTTNTLEVTYSVRDTNINDIEIKKGDYICIYNNELIACDKDKTTAIKKAVDIIDLSDKEFVTVIYGKDSSEDEASNVCNLFTSKNSILECYPLNGTQDIYSYIIGIN